jgi:hypothetical protein
MMSVTVVWDNDEHTIIRYVFGDPWGWQEIREAAVQSNGWLDGSPLAHIHFIYDMRTTTTVPNGAITQLKTFVGTEHPKTGASFVVGARKNAVVLLAQSLLNVMHRLHDTGWKFGFVDTIEQARAALGETIRAEQEA